MSIGSAVRRMMSPAMERRAAGAYRAVFVDLATVAERLAEHLPSGAKLLDIGGGDGELLNRLLDLRPDLSVAMVDVADSVGKFVKGEHRSRVAFFPGAPVEEHVAGRTELYDAALVSDVMHHLPVPYRTEFLRSVYSALAPGAAIFVKDIEPGYFISALSLFCDKYISGDRRVVLVPQQELRALADGLPGHVVSEIGLYERDRPNYILKLDFAVGDAVDLVRTCRR